MGGSITDITPGLRQSIQTASLKQRLYGNCQTFLKSLLQLLHQFPMMKPFLMETVTQLGDESIAMEPQTFYQNLLAYLDALPSKTSGRSENMAALFFRELERVSGRGSGGAGTLKPGEEDTLFSRSRRQIAIRFFRLLLETQRHLGSELLLSTLSRNNPFLLSGVRRMHRLSDQPLNPLEEDVSEEG